MLNPNTIVGGRYKVVKPLGGGGMKLVYLAEDLRLASRRCALAEMVDSLTNPDMQRQAVSAFQREADMLAQLSNEHIPRIFDRFSEQNHHYLVMEYIEGGTLEQALKTAGGKLDETRVLDIALQVLDTLIYLHGLNPPVVYRDLKPSNVMLTPSGQAKLIDFGIARHFQPQSNATMIGTQGYAPPEQYRGKVEIRSDLYALGATMHHALSGRDPTTEPPFSFPPLRGVAPKVAAALAEVVDQALSYEVEGRILNAFEFKRRLIEIKAGAISAASGVSARGAAPGVKGRPQLNLPLSGSGPAPSPSPSAPTILSNPSEILCPRCSRYVPADSRFCSFCAADLRRVLGPAEVVSEPEAETAILSGDQGPVAYGTGATHGLSRRRRRRERRLLSRLGGLMALFLAAYLGAKLLSSLASNPANPVPPEGSAAPPYPEAPETGSKEGEPEHHSPRAIALRQWLDQQGYRSVHFRIDRDTVELWGTVPTWADRMMVQTSVYAVTGLVSLEDHLKVQHDEFGFGEP